MVTLNYLNLTPPPTLWSVVMLAASLHCGTVGGGGGFGVRAEEKEKVQVYGWYMVPTDAHMVDMQMLLRAGAATPAANCRTGAVLQGTDCFTCNQVCIAHDFNACFVTALRGARRGLSRPLSRDKGRTMGVNAHPLSRDKGAH